MMLQACLANVYTHLVKTLPQHQAVFESRLQVSLAAAALRLLC